MDGQVYIFLYFVAAVALRVEFGNGESGVPRSGFTDIEGLDVSSDHEPDEVFARYRRRFADAYGDAVAEQRQAIAHEFQVETQASGGFLPKATFCATVIVCTSMKCWWIIPMPA